MNPHSVTKEFEEAIAEYCGSKYAVATTSCTSALLLCCVLHEVEEVTIPKKTYIGVGQSILNAGGTVKFSEKSWAGTYQLYPYPIIDAAKRLRRNMYVKGMYMCLSLHISKILGVDQGGVILHNDPEADKMLRRMRFDGRSENVAPKNDTFVRGFHCYLSPNVAAQALWKLSTLPDYNEDLPMDDYGDLSEQRIFQ